MSTTLVSLVAIARRDGRLKVKVEPTLASLSELHSLFIILYKASYTLKAKQPSAYDLPQGPQLHLNCTPHEISHRSFISFPIMTWFQEDSSSKVNL